MVTIMALSWAHRRLLHFPSCHGSVRLARSSTKHNPPDSARRDPGQGQVTGRSRGRGIRPEREHPILAIGAPAPDFSLPGIDGKNALGEYANAKILAVVFESNHSSIHSL